MSITLPSVDDGWFVLEDAVGQLRALRGQLLARGDAQLFPSV